MIYNFGPFQVRVRERLLLREDKLVRLPPKVFDTLLVLVENCGHLVEKEVLLQAIWPDTFVEESNLTNYISILRKILADSDPSHYIETIPKRGYRFVAAVRTLDGEPSGQPVEHKQPEGMTQYTGTDISRDPGPHAELNPVLLDGGATGAGASATAVKRVPVPSARLAVPHVAQSIAVLPFKEICGVDQKGQLGLSMTDALITRLSNHRRFVVRPTALVLRYNSEHQDPVAAGQALAVDLVLVGNLQKVDDRLRLTAQLVSVKDGASFWAHKVEERFTDIFDLQDRISERLAASLVQRLTGETADTRTPGTTNPEAYHAYLKGRYCCDKRTEEGLKKSLEYFEEAISIDPSFAPAYNGMADSYTFLWYYNYLSQQEALPKAKAAVSKGLQIYEPAAEAHASMAAIKFYYDWDWTAAEEEFKRAIQLNPHFARVHQLYSFYLNASGRYAESLREIEMAHQLDPISPLVNAGLGLPYLFRGEYDRAIDLFRKTVEMEPGFWLAYVFLADAYAQTQEFGKAIIMLRKSDRVGSSPWALAKLGTVHAQSGNMEKSRDVIRELTKLSERKYVSPYFFAMNYAARGEKDDAIAWLERAYNDRVPWMVYLRIESAFFTLRSDPRFEELARMVGFSS